jgi:hypothetical protein
MSLVHATLEPNSHNTDGSTVVLYFNQAPSEAEVVLACKELELPLRVDTSDEFFEFEEHATPVSDRANLFRYEVYPTC